MYLLYILVAFLAVSAKQASCRTTSCTIDLNAEFKPQEEPLFLDLDGKKILYPTDGSKIQVNGGDKLRVFCGSKNFKNFEDFFQDTLIIECVNGNRFKTVGPQTTEGKLLKNFSCKAPLKSSIIKGGRCGLIQKSDIYHYTEYEIGFQVEDHFLSIIDVCFNTVLKSVLWSRHTVSPSVQYYMPKVNRPRFIQDRKPYGKLLKVEHLYDRNHQEETISQLVSSKSLAQKYIQKDDHSLAYFARSHLSPNGDFVYAGEQLATFHYINVAPQWQYFKEGQWEKIESALRDYIVHKGVKASVLTGNLGITQFEDAKGDDKDIYLYYNRANGEKLVKVPKFYYKMVQFEESSSSAQDVVIVGVIQPYDEHVRMTTNVVICEDVCHRYPQLASISQHNDDRQSPSGYAYCCTVSEFMSFLESTSGHMIEHNKVHAGGNKNKFELHEDNSFGSNQKYVKTM